MALTVAGFVDGSQVPAELVRRLTDAAVGGESTVIRPADLKASALSTPGAGVVVNAGSGVAVSEFPNAPSQSYLVTNDAATTVPIPVNNTANTVTWYLHIRVSDPQYAGEPTPPDPLTALYNDWAVTASLPSGVPVLTVATIVLPPYTSAVTAGMITDTRPFLGRERTRKWTHNPASDINMSKSAYTSWPLLSLPEIVHPTWASEMQVTVHINGIEYSGSGTGVAGIRIVHNGAATTYSQNGIITAAQPSRQAQSIMGTFPVSAADRGVVRYVGVQAYQTAGAGVFSLDYQSAQVTEITWTEGRA